MAELLTICIALPLLAAVAAAQAHARNIAIGALGTTLALLLEVLWRVLAEPVRASEAWLIADRLNCVPMVLLAGLALVTLIAAPRRDINRRFLVTLLTLTSATLTAYAAANLLVFLIGWIVPVLLFRPRGVLAASALLLAVAAILIGVAAPLSITSVSGTREPWAFGLLVLAAILRDRIFSLSSHDG